jgi:hypothetical protein
MRKIFKKKMLSKIYRRCNRLNSGLRGWG